MNRLIILILIGLGIFYFIQNRDINSNSIVFIIGGIIILLLILRNSGRKGRGRRF